MIIFTQEEKRRIDTLLSAFHEYIFHHPYFDIGTTTKSGCVRLILGRKQDLLDFESLLTHDDLLSALYTEIVDDVRDERIASGDDSCVLTKAEAEEARRRALSILKNIDLETDRDYCVNFLDKFLESELQ